MSDLTSRLITFLRWSQKYTKTDMVYLASRSGLGVIAQVTISLATLAFAVVVGHYLPKETYGEYKYVLSIIAILSLFSLNSIGGAVFQSTAKGYTGALHQGFWANIRWSFFVFSGALALALYYFWFHNPVLAAEILIGGSLSPLLASASLYSPFLDGKKDFTRQMLYSIIDNIFTTGVMVVAVLLTTSPLLLVCAYFISNTLGAFYFYRRTKILYASDEKKQDTGMLTFSKHLSALGVLGGIVDAVDQILIFHFAGAAQLAVFAFATALPDQFKTPTKTLSTMISSGFARRTKNEIHHGMTNKFWWYFVFAVCVVVAYLIAAPYIFRLFFPAYMDSVFYSQVYMLGFLAITFDPIQSYFGIHKMVKEFYIGGIFSILCQAITMIVGVLWWGILGLVVAQVFTRIASALLTYALYIRAKRNDLAALS
ncbi:oligosaccharide flippase family protein [Candidatus Kaiserbacteria bacterium]|nr:oligosaccharide flippase family protein [Candidatus Kaiserbacteria bacterium]